MDESVHRMIMACFDKTINTLLSAGGDESKAMKELLGKQEFRSEFLATVEQDIIEEDNFPHARYSALSTVIRKRVNLHLGKLYVKEAQKQTKAKLQEKFDSDMKEACEGFDKKLRDLGIF